MQIDNNNTVCPKITLPKNNTKRRFHYQNFVEDLKENIKNAKENIILYEIYTVEHIKETKQQ